jgi:hypothetical protein
LNLSSTVISPCLILSEVPFTYKPYDKHDVNIVPFGIVGHTDSNSLLKLLIEITNTPSLAISTTYTTKFSPVDVITEFVVNIIPGIILVISSIFNEIAPIAGDLPGSYSTFVIYLSLVAHSNFNILSLLLDITEYACNRSLSFPVRLILFRYIFP